MKIITLLMFLGFLEVHASTSAQNLTINQHNTSLEKVFTEIKKQTGYLFLYNQQWIKLSKNVDINVKNAPLTEVLDICFTNQPLTYSIVDKTIVLQIKKKAFADSQPVAAPIAINVTGVVKDGKGDPLPGVSVMVKGTSLGIQTDIDGKYKLTVADGDAILVFKFIGFKTKEVKVGSQQVLNVTLEEATSELSEVVVSGYSVKSRAEFTGSSSHIGAKALTERPVTSFDQALAGQAAGVKITSSSGSLNSPPVFRIRGSNSISSSSYPLVIIDGVTAFTGNVGNSAENNPLSTINPDDIESAEVLKDAAATALYGSRGTNGVLVITTKKGKQGTAKVSYTGFVGMNKTPRLPKLLSAEDYVMIKNESLANNGLAPQFFLGTNPDGSTLRTKWYDYVYQTGISHNHNLSISGGSPTTHYFFSGNYSNQTGFLKKNTFERGGTRFNIDHKLMKNVTIGANVSYTNTLNNNLTSGFDNAFGLNNLVRMSMVLPPNVSPFNPDGSYNTNGAGLGAGPNGILTGYYNPLPQLEHDKFTSESKSFIGNVFLEWQIVKGLTGKINYALNDLNTVNMGFNNPYQAGGFAPNGSATNSNGVNRRSDVLGQLTYDKTFGKHHVNAFGVYQEIYTKTTSWGVTRQNLNDRFYESFFGSYATVSGSTSNYTEVGLKSFLGSFSYDYDKKYLFSASIRRDGFSSLAQKWGNFPAVSVGWNIAEEDFFKNSGLGKTISTLKLKGGYGLTGNSSGVATYAYASLYSSGVYGGLSALSPSQIGNSELSWETSKKTDVGLTVGLWNNRVTIDADYYDNNNDNLILNVPQAASKGIPGNSLTRNIGSLYNRGLEFNIEAHIIDKGKFRWTSSFNISTLSNKVTSLAPGVNDLWTSGLETSNITRVGYPLGAMYVVKTTGVNPANGLRMYENRNGQTVQYNPRTSGWTYLDGTVAPTLDAYGDGVIMGTTLPKYYGGFNNNFTYGNFDLTLNFTYSGGNLIYNGTKGTLLDNRFFNNQTDILRRWTTPGQITDIPKLHYNDQIASGSVLMNSYNVEDGTFIKMNYAAIGYRLPAKLLSKAGISSMRIYATGGNFLLYTKYTGSDPEVSANGDSSTGAGRDKNSLPAGKTFTFGLSVGF
ncbi:TonB-dependent receptor [Mucilaginibacter auburnensis]|nr:TonB-dependent receptor [Mucilaginibacter auburnensis]